PTPPTQKPPKIDGAKTINIDFVETPLADVVKFMAQVTGRNFILTDDLKGDVTIISHKPVPVRTAYEAFISALEVHGYTTVTVGGMTKIVPTANAANAPIPIYTSGIIPYDTDNFVTQIIQLENVSVSDVSSVVKDLGGKGAKIIAYAPTNTLIITDAAVNIRRVYRILSQLDVASPKSKMEIIPLSFATATDVEKVIEELYGSQETSSSSSSSSSSKSRDRSRRRRGKKDTPKASGASAQNVGSEGKYIEKIISDERTNSLIVMANEEAIDAVKKLIAELDVDVDPSRLAQIQVVYLEHAKAEDVAQVLSQLGNGSGNSNNNSNSRNSSNSRNTRRRPGQAPTPGRGASAEAETGGAVAAFEEGLRITSDESTNSLVLIATRDQFAIIRQVIDKLDIPRKQVFVEAVILEMATDDANTAGLSFHAGSENSRGGTNLYSAQVGGSSSVVPDQSLLSGMAVGVFGPSIPVALGPSAATATGDSDGASASTVNIPAFGIVLNALQTNSAVNIVSTPNILTMDNEEAKIVVGRNVPFPMGQTQSTMGFAPITNFQREDVAITLKVTPQINESDFVTLETFLEIQEIEGDIAGTADQGGPTTSKRSVENTIVVKDNQTIVVGGLISETTNETETKIPILGDIPLIGRLFRGTTDQSRKSNLMIFLTPHIIDEPADLEEIYRVKWAQRQEFIRRFYGRSREEQEAEMARLMSFSFNQIDQPSKFRGPTQTSGKYQVVGEQAPSNPVSTGAPPEPPASDAAPASPPPSDPPSDDSAPTP
ncbi:MAG TPA: type II secretion system protein GspD, partial [Deltaproteobacteria bacterium]|nr:type II secretion system protein GspD [Deltaproteobacteria bacterium]